MKNGVVIDILVQPKRDRRWAALEGVKDFV